MISATLFSKKKSLNDTVRIVRESFSGLHEVRGCHSDVYLLTDKLSVLNRTWWMKFRRWEIKITTTVIFKNIKDRYTAKYFSYWSRAETDDRKPGEQRWARATGTYRIMKRNSSFVRSTTTRYYWNNYAEIDYSSNLFKNIFTIIYGI